MSIAGLPSLDAPDGALGSSDWSGALPPIPSAFSRAHAPTRRGNGSHRTKRGPFRSSFTLNLAATPICAVKQSVSDSGCRITSTVAGS